jgi:beta-lactamase class A
MSHLLFPLEEAPAITWSACVLDAATGDVLDARDPDLVLPTASVGKLLLLHEVARRLASGELDPTTPLRRTPDDEVGDSGLWQHLRVDMLPVDDLAVLVGSVSDNLATNVLLRAVGLDAVAEVGPSLGLPTLRLHDRVRDVRTSEHPTTLSEGSARDLAGFAALLATEDATEWALLRRWLSTGVDVGLVAGHLNFDPLAHIEVDRGRRFLNKTGRDPGTLADVGILGGQEGVRAYAVVASWSADAGHRDEAIRAMRYVGSRLSSGL